MGLKHPLFQALEVLLDQEGSVSLGELLDRAGDQTYGLGIVLLSLTCFIPGVANGVALGSLALGLQMAFGAPHPWIPRRVQLIEVHRGKVKRLLAHLEANLARLGKRVNPRRELNTKAMGALVTWTAFLLFLPLPLPLSNLLPGISLILIGMGLLEGWPLLAWLGGLGSLATTFYFSLSARLILKELHLGWYWLVDRMA